MTYKTVFIQILTKMILRYSFTGLGYEDLTLRIIKLTT